MGNKAPKTAWKAGQSGNPKGKSPRSPELRAAFTAATPEALTFLIKVMRDVVQETKDRMQAAKTIIEWGLPKPAPELGKTDGSRLDALVEALKGGGNDKEDDT